MLACMLQRPSGGQFELPASSSAGQFQRVLNPLEADSHVGRIGFQPGPQRAEVAQAAYGRRLAAEPAPDGGDVRRREPDAVQRVPAGAAPTPSCQLRQPMASIEMVGRPEAPRFVITTVWAPAWSALESNRTR